MAATDLASGYATITAIAALANPRNVPGSKKKLILDAEIFVGGEKCETLLGALSFFNKSDMNFEHSGIALYLIYSTIAQADEPADTQPNDLSPHYDFIGDIQWIIPLSIPSDGEEPEQSPSIDPAQRAYVHLSGYAANCDQHNATFDVNISQYISITRPKSGLKTKPTASFACTVLDSPRYEKFGRPMPYGKQFVFATGFLANAIVTTGVSKPRKVKQFVVEVDNVVFGPAGSATATALPNDLDTPSKTPVRLGRGLLSYNRKASESPTPTPTTPTPAQPNRVAKRKRLESESSADLFNDENVSLSRSS